MDRQLDAAGGPSPFPFVYFSGGESAAVGSEPLPLLLLRSAREFYYVIVVPPSRAPSSQTLLNPQGPHTERNDRRHLLALFANATSMMGDFFRSTIPCKTSPTTTHSYQLEIGSKIGFLASDQRAGNIFFSFYTIFLFIATTRHRYETI